MHPEVVRELSLSEMNLNVILLLVVSVIIYNFEKIINISAFEIMVASTVIRGYLIFCSDFSGKGGIL